MLGQSLRDQVAGVWLALLHRDRSPVFVTSADASQNAADIFKSEWVGAFPPAAGVRAGQAPLYDDSRMRWWIGQRDVRGQHVVELGPMEGGHTWQLLSGGAASVTAIESNSRSYLKCLVAKEILGMEHAHFLCADFIEWLERHDREFDICLASGVLYHMKEPLRMLELVCRRARALFLWTHYYDARVVQTDGRHHHRFIRPVDMEWKGFRATAQYRSYGAVKRSFRHLGGSAPYSLWMNRDDILAAIRHYGMKDIRIHEDNPGHVNGPALTLFATSV